MTRVQFGLGAAVTRFKRVGHCMVATKNVRPTATDYLSANIFYPRISLMCMMKDL